MITIKLNSMATEQDPGRVDVWIEDDTDPGAFGFAGEITLSDEEYEKLSEVDDDDGIRIEVN